MKVFGKRGIVGIAAALFLLAAAGSAVAATQAGPPKSPPRYGMQQGAGAGGFGIMAGGVVMDAAADYLGMTETALAAARHDGKSLAQIAVAQGKTAAGLQQALVSAFKVKVDAAVAAGKLTQAQATQMLTTFQARVQTQINRTDTGPVGGRGAGAGLGLGFGPGACGGRR